MLEAVSSSVTNVLGWVGTVVDGLTATDGDLAALLPLFAIGIGASLFMFAMVMTCFTVKISKDIDLQVSI